MSERGNTHFIFSSRRTGLCRQNLQARSAGPAEPGAGPGPEERSGENPRLTRGDPPGTPRTAGAGRPLTHPRGGGHGAGRPESGRLEPKPQNFPARGRHRAGERRSPRREAAGEGGRAAAGMAAGAGAEGGEAVSAGIPGAGRPRAPHGGLTRAGASRGRAGAADPDPVPEPRRTPDSHGFQRSNPQLPHGRPLGPSRPARRPGSGRKKERRRRRAAPLTMIRGGGGAAAPAGDALSRVAGVLCPRSRAPRSSPPTPTPTPRARTPPPRLRPLGLAPLQRGAPSRRAVSGARRSALRPLPWPGPRPPPREGAGEGAGPAGRPLGAASRAPSRVPGFSRSTAAPPAGRAVICRLSGRPRGSRAPGSDPPPASASAPWEAAMTAGPWEDRDGEGQGTGPAVGWAPWRSSARSRENGVAHAGVRV